MSKAWFETWFNTDYYHLLYRNRNEVEARQFIDALLHFLHPTEHARFIDVACGKGRHSRYLHSLGYDVTGIDLSKNSIDEANACAAEEDGLTFIQHDIRAIFPVSNMDVAANLFTSFGYFDNDDEHQQALDNMQLCLKPGGKLVIDFLNTSQVLHNFKQEDLKVIDGIQFKVTRSVDEKCIVKHIEVTDGEEVKKYEERVRAFTKEDLEHIILQAGLTIDHIFGNYQLDGYDERSPRVVIIAQKKA
ncbi:MAG: class I SAM-dependent methyltransferase [Flavobacteriales bacterium]|nr:class I SAM-dependent methyltransferase [Flavobacteriales bacterium]